LNEITLLDILLYCATFFCLIAGLAINWHKNVSLFVYSCYYFISDITNPILFMLNESHYTYYGWGAVRSFDFSMKSLLKSYTGSYFVFSFIVFLTILINFSGLFKNFSLINIKSNYQKRIFLNYYYNNNKILYIFCFSLLFIYYFLFEYRIAITGVGGELPYHLSGIIHYFRIYIISIVLAIIVSKSKENWQMIVTVFLYAFVAGIAASSRLIVVITISTLVFQFAYRKRFILVFISLLFIVVMWFIISTSRNLTFSNEQYNLFEVIYYSLTENKLELFIILLDQMTGRMSGAQQIVLAYQLRGIEGCGFIFNFFLGESICNDTVGEVYGLDLSGTSFGLGMSVIPSIIISGLYLTDYILPIIAISIFISLTEFLYRKANSNLRFISIGYLYLFLSITFLFTGPLIYYYYIQLSIFLIFIASICLKKFVLSFMPLKKNRGTVVENYAKLNESN